MHIVREYAMHKTKCAKFRKCLERFENAALNISTYGREIKKKKK